MPIPVYMFCVHLDVACQPIIVRKVSNKIHSNPINLSNLSSTPSKIIQNETHALSIPYLFATESNHFAIIIISQFTAIATVSKTAVKSQVTNSNERCVQFCFAVLNGLKTNTK